MWADVVSCGLEESVGPPQSEQSGASSICGAQVGDGTMTTKLIATGLVVAALVGAGPALAYTGAKLARNAKVTIDQATAIALKARPGKITDKELERESGG